MPGPMGNYYFAPTQPEKKKGWLIQSTSSTKFKALHALLLLLMVLKSSCIIIIDGAKKYFSTIRYKMRPTLVESKSNNLAPQL